MQKKTLFMFSVLLITCTALGRVSVSVGVLVPLPTFDQPWGKGVVSGQSSGLQAYWSFNSMGGTIAEESVSGFNGSISGAQWVSGVFANALDFDGVDDYVNVSQTGLAALGGLTQGTISLWFNYRYNLDQQEIQPLFYLGINDESEPDNMFIIEVGHSNPANRRLYVTWVVNGQIPLCYDTGFNLDNDSWYHFAVVVGPTGNTGYLNGTELVNRHYNFGDASLGHFLWSIPVQDQLTFGYGKTADGKSPHFLSFRGIIDEVCIYDRPLSTAEVQELMTHGLPDNLREVGLPLLVSLTLSFVLLVVLVIHRKRRKSPTL